MRIVHVVRQFHPGIGGLESVVWELATAQAAHGHSVRVVTLDRLFDNQVVGRLPGRELTSGIEIVRIPYRGSNRYPIAPSVLHHLGSADIVHVHGIDFFFDFLAATFPLHRRKLVVSTHGGFFHTSYASALKRVYFSTVTRLLIRAYAGVAAVSLADQQLFGAVRTQGISLIENGVNVAKFSEAAAHAPTKSMIFVGRFSGNKGLDRLLRFFASVRQRDSSWTLKIAGRPADLTARDLTRLAAAVGVEDCVDIIESPTDDAIRDAMSGCSVIVSASEYEGFGLAVVEGMSAGLYPVLNDIAPFRHLVDQTRLGSIVHFANPESAASDFLARWQEIALNFCAVRQSLIEASSRYSWQTVSQRYEALYDFALGKRMRSILDIAVGVSTFEEAVEHLDLRFDSGSHTPVVFANAHTLNTIRTDAHTRSMLRGAVVFNDGVGIDIASWILFGKAFPENLNGTDFIPRYLQHTRHRYRIFLIGAKPGIAPRAAIGLSRLTPHHRIVGCCHGYLSAKEVEAVVDDIRESRADIVLVAMGNPNQERWLMEHLADTGCRLGFGVGALFDFMADAVPRAPHWMRAKRMEWLFRLLQEPQRLSRRYLVDMPLFLVRVAGQWWKGVRVSMPLD